MAKDVALFSSVVKDLGNVLEAGQSTTLYRKEAYESSFAITKECKAIFNELQDVVQQSSRGGAAPAEGQLDVDDRSKVMWVFRKPKVHMIRESLESLKSTITVQLGVLSYAAMLKDAKSK